MKSGKQNETTLAKLSMFTTKSTGESKEDYKKILGNLALDWNEAALCAYSYYPFGESSKDFEKYVLKSPEAKHRFEIWDTTCHLQAAMAGLEQDHLFLMEDVMLQSLCQAALKKATQEIKVESEIIDSAPYLLGGIAFWNLLLSKNDGGIFPDDKYNEFMTHIHQELTKYKNKLLIGTVDDMKQAFLDFKKYALIFQHIKADLRKELVELMAPPSDLALKK